MVNCFKGIATILKALRLKKCHSSCCDIEIEVASPPATPATKNTAKEKNIVIKSCVEDLSRECQSIGITRYKKSIPINFSGEVNIPIKGITEPILTTSKIDVSSIKNISANN